MARLGINNDIEFCEFLLEKAQVAVVPGSAFGVPGYVRLSFATSMENLQEAIKRLHRVLDPD
jgi:aspartate aminotransferase